MIFIIGGSYQGKLDFARQHFALQDSDIFICAEDGPEIDFTRRCLAYVDRWALKMVRNGEEPLKVFLQNQEALKDAVVIANDISCGVVPVDAQLRAWREACGRLNNHLARQAGEVWRLFCGLPQRVK